MRAPTRPTYRLTDGCPATGWVPAPLARRTVACALDIVLFAVSVGIGWIWWAWRTAARGTTPGKALLGLTVFSSDTRRPATRRQMVLRGVVYQGVAALIGVATLGIGWVYGVLGVLGENRRTLYDEWAQVVVLAKPPSR